MIVTVAGLPGSGNTTAARKLSAHYGWRLVTAGETFKKLAQEHGVPPGKLDKFWQTPEGKSPETHHKIDEITKQIARSEKNVVLNCKLGAIQVPEADLKILLTAPLEVRAQRNSQRDGVPIEDTKKSIDKRLKDERREWKKIYGKDYTDPKLYDVVLNTEHFNAEQVFEIIRKIVDEKIKNIAQRS